MWPSRRREELTLLHHMPESARGGALDCFALGLPADRDPRDRQGMSGGAFGSSRITHGRKAVAVILAALEFGFGGLK